MYTGRSLLASIQDDKLKLNYLVNSRSFKNREFYFSEGAVAVVPNKDSLDDFRNPYVTYNCLRYNDHFSVLSNGSQTDPIYEKIVRGVPPRDALVQVMHGMDYEFDSQNTPRIAIYACIESYNIYTAIVKEDEIHIKEIALSPNKLFMLTTNEFNQISYDKNAYEVQANTDLLKSSPIIEMEHNILTLEVTMKNKVEVSQIL